MLTWQSVRHRPPGARPLVMAHRGASDDLPENTLAAFGLALEQGADVLETDLRFTRDDEILLMHDSTVDRTTNGSGAVSEMTLAEIKKFRAHKPSPLAPPPLNGGGRTNTRGPENTPDTESPEASIRASANARAPHETVESSTSERAFVRGEGVPTLEELLQFTRGEVPLALELKDSRFENRRDAERLVDLLIKYGVLEKCVLVSFHLARLLSFKPIAPNLPIGMITLTNAFPLFPTEFLGPFWPLLYANPFYVRWARRLGKIVCPLDPAPEPRLRYYCRLGVSVLLTNHPGRTVQAVDRMWQGANDAAG